MSEQQQQASGRLPSFRGPRDLSLLTTATSSLSLTTNPTSHSSGGGIVIRPKRVFKPNIPPKRDKEVEKVVNPPNKEIPIVNPPNKEVPGPSSSIKSPDKTQQQFLKSSNVQRGRGSRGRGGRGRGQNFIQSSSVFAEGVGDPLSVTRTRSRGGRGGRGNTIIAGASRGSRSVRLKSSFTRENLDEIIKKEHPLEHQEAKADFNDVIGDEVEEGQEQEIEKFEPENEAVVLPLTNYLPKIKNDQKLKPEVIDSSSASFLHYKDERPMDFLTVAGKSLKNPILCLFQLPSHLPVLMEQEKRQLTTSLETLPEGCIGKMQFLADGRTRFILQDSQTGGEENVFDVEPGKDTGFRQDLTSIDLENGRLTELGPVQHKFVITPDIETILLNMK